MAIDIIQRDTDLKSLLHYHDQQHGNYHRHKHHDNDLRYTDRCLYFVRYLHIPNSSFHKLKRSFKQEPHIKTMAVTLVTYFWSFLVLHGNFQARNCMLGRDLFNKISLQFVNIPEQFLPYGVHEFILKIEQQQNTQTYA